jgi:hypothetical protein
LGPAHSCAGLWCVSGSQAARNSCPGGALELRWCRGPDPRDHPRGSGRRINGCPGDRGGDPGAGVDDEPAAQSCNHRAAPHRTAPHRTGTLRELGQTNTVTRCTRRPPRSPERAVNGCRALRHRVRVVQLGVIRHRPQARPHRRTPEHLPDRRSVERRRLVQLVSPCLAPSSGVDRATCSTAGPPASGQGGGIATMWRRTCWRGSCWRSGIWPPATPRRLHRTRARPLLGPPTSAVLGSTHAHHGLAGSRHPFGDTDVTSAGSLCAGEIPGLRFTEP